MVTVFSSSNSIKYKLKDSKYNLLMQYIQICKLINEEKEVYINDIRIVVVQYWAIISIIKSIEVFLGLSSYYQ